MATIKQLIITLFGLFLLSPAYAGEHPVLSADELAWLRGHPAPIRVHNELDWRPYNFNEAGKPKGYSIDYLNLVAKKLGLKIEYISGPSWYQFLEMMRDRSLDLMINIASTQERRTYLAFTEPYLITSTSLFIRKSEYNISDLNDLVGKKIGFTKGFFFGEFIRKYYPEIEIVTFDSTLASLIGVDKGLVDAAIELPVVVRWILLQAKLNTLKLGGIVSDPRFITTFAIATHKDNQILRGIIQKGMDAISPTEELSIRRKWKIEETELPLISAEEESYLEKLGALRICVNPNRLPLEAINRDGTLTGISSEFVKLLGERVKIPLDVLQTQNWGETLKLVEQGKCDLLPMVIKTKERQGNLNFTSPWLSIPIVVATRSNQIYISNIEQLMDQKIGVVKGIAIKNILLSAYPKINIVEVESVHNGLKMVNDGKLFGFIDAIPAISHALQTDSITRVKISGSVGLNMDYTIGVKSKDDRLLAIMERVLGSIEKDQITNIYNRWLAVAYIDRFDYTRFWQVLVGVIFFTLYVLYRFRRGLQITSELRDAHTKIKAINHKLKKQVRTDTLTKIANRLKIDEELLREYTRFERYKEPFSIILLDIDHFKRVNDTHGHHVGDEILKLIALALNQNTRANDISGRWGGEEFLVVCPSTMSKGAQKLAEILRLAILNCVTNNLPPQTASFGVATIQNGDSIHDLVKRADDALYRAKKGGRNRVESSPMPIE